MVGFLAAGFFSSSESLSEEEEDSFFFGAASNPLSSLWPSGAERKGQPWECVWRRARVSWRRASWHRRSRCRRRRRRSLSWPRGLQASESVSDSQELRERERWVRGTLTGALGAGFLGVSSSSSESESELLLSFFFGGLHRRRVAARVRRGKGLESEYGFLTGAFWAGVFLAAAAARVLGLASSSSSLSLLLSSDSAFFCGLRPRKNEERQQEMSPLLAKCECSLPLQAIGLDWIWRRDKRFLGDGSGGLLGGDGGGLLGCLVVGAVVGRVGGRLGGRLKEWVSQLARLHNPDR